MADVPNPPRALKDYAVPSQAEPHNSIVAPTIARNDFELKPSLLSAVQQNQFWKERCPTPFNILTCQRLGKKCKRAGSN